MNIILKCFTDGWRACLTSELGEVLDTTVDVYPTATALLSRIEESKMWFEYLADRRTPLDYPLFASRERVATVVDNNQAGCQHIVETAPNVTLLVGTPLYTNA